MPTKSTELLNREVLKWEKQWRIAQANTAGKQPYYQQYPVISISSAYGSHGLMVGKIVSEIMDLPIYDRELIEEIATNAKVHEKNVDALDERVKDWITEHVASQFANEIFTTSDYLRHLSKAMLSISRNGSAIIIGRGSQFILNHEQTLRVRTTAPLNVRIETVAKLNKIGMAEARAAVLHKDGARAAFCKFHFNKDVTHADFYDVILNTERGPLEQFAELIVYLFLLKFGQVTK